MDLVFNKCLKRFREEHENASPDYLWQLKLTKDEYMELKNNIKNNFSNLAYIAKDVTLYFAEWWRREYSSGQVDTRDIYSSIFDEDDMSKSAELYNVAKYGLTLLGLEIIKTKGEERYTTQYLYSILYQGGLPMNSIANAPNGQGGWRNLFRCLVWNEQDIDEVAPMDARMTPFMSSSIRKFSDLIRESVRTQDFLPFAYDEKWFEIIKHGAEENDKRKNRQPFSFKWKVVVNEINKKLDLQFDVKGPQILPKEFIESHNLQNLTTISLSILVNGQSISFASFSNRYSRRTPMFNATCHYGDVVSLVINEIEEVLWKRWLDFSDPKLLSISDEYDSIYSLCDPHKLALVGENCIIIASNNWNSESLESKDYRIGDETVKVFSIAGGTASVQLSSSSTNEVKTISAEKPLLWTGIDESGALRFEVPVKEQIYNANNVCFTKGRGENTVERASEVRFADKGSQSWNEKAALGEIRAKIHLNNNESVDPVRFINVGQLNIRCLSSSAKECTIQIEWPEGSVTSAIAKCVGGQTWRMERDGKADMGYVPFRFTPRSSLGRPFDLHLMPVFRDFIIFDIDGNPVQGNAIIPIADINSYSYSLVFGDNDRLILSFGIGRLNYVYSRRGGGKNSARRNYFDDTANYEIPEHGPLTRLFDVGDEVLRSQLEQSMESLPDAHVEMHMDYNNNQTRNIHFKDFPYHLHYDKENGKLAFNSRCTPATSPEKLLALPLFEPEEPPVLLNGVSGMYELPSDGTGVKEWIVYGDNVGYVLPVMVDIEDPGKSKEDRNYTRNTSLEEIKQQMKSAECSTAPIWQRTVGWFKHLSMGKIPGTSILELVAISEDRGLMMKFASILAFGTEGDEYQLELLKRDLLVFQHQMSFVWKWGEELNLWVLNNFIDSDTFQNVSDQFIGQLSTWYDSLREDSIPERTLKDPNTNDYRDSGYEGVNGESAQRAFQSIMIQTEGHDTRDELWIKRRREFSRILETKNLSGYLDEKRIPHDENVRRVIRQSIIYGLKYKLRDEI